MSRKPLQAFNVAVLGTDTARISGYALRIKGRLIWSGEVDTLRPDLVTAIVLDAAARARDLTVPLTVILERAYGGPMRTVEGLAAARERWMMVCREHRVSRTHTVYPSRWRADLFGPRKGMRRAGWRALEMATAQGEVRRGVVLGADEAAAICISRWGTHAPL